MVSDINQFNLKRDVFGELLKVAQGIQGSSEHGRNTGNTVLAYSDTENGIAGDPAHVTDQCGLCEAAVNCSVMLNEKELHTQSETDVREI